MRASSWSMRFALVLSGLWLVPISSASAQESLPGLDELLGIESDEQDTQQPAETETETERQLREQLENETEDNDFFEAVRLMGLTAVRLRSQFDAGEDTQRLQASVLRKLDLIIEAAEQNSSSSSSSSSSSQQQQQQSSQPDQQQQPSDGEPSQSDSQQESDAPAGSDARPGASVAPDRASWGQLPERVREALQQGSNDRFSAVYRRMTEAYYRRLAEEVTE